MGHDGDEAAPEEGFEGLPEAAQAGLGEFDQNVRAAVDGVAGGMSDGVLDIVEAQMKIAAAMDAGTAAGGAAQLADAFVDDGLVVPVAVIGMRGSDDIGGAARGGELEHADRILQRAGAVIESPED